jgi:sucrose-6-phosphate hydrolase SacC (GH32 family)
VSFDDMETFVKYDQNPVIAGRPSGVNLDFRDPFIWKEGNTWYMVIGAGIAGVGGNTVLYASNDLYNWKDSYQGIFYQGQIADGEGEFWEVPIVHKFPNGKYMFLVQKTPDASSPARTFYWIGNFNGKQFIPDHEEARDFEVINGFLSPTVTVDAEGRTTAIGIIPDEVSPIFQQQAGWAHLFSLPQVWELNSNNELQITPHPNISKYRGEMSEYSNVSLTPEVKDYLNERGRYYEIGATFNTGSASKIGFVLGRSDDGTEQLKVFYNIDTQEWVIDASQSSLAEGVRKDIRRGAYYPIAAGETFDVRIFVDGSVLEVFINGEDHFTGRFFPTLPSADGIEIFVEGGNATAENVKIWKMQSSSN